MPGVPLVGTHIFIVIEANPYFLNDLLFPMALTNFLTFVIVKNYLNLSEKDVI